MKLKRFAYERQDWYYTYKESDSWYFNREITLEKFMEEDSKTIIVKHVIPTLHDILIFYEDKSISELT